MSAVVELMTSILEEMENNNFNRSHTFITIYEEKSFFLQEEDRYQIQQQIKTTLEACQKKINNGDPQAKALKAFFNTRHRRKTKLRDGQTAL